MKLFNSVRSTGKKLNIIYQCFLKVTYAPSFWVSEKYMLVGIVNVLLNQEEINENEEEQHNSVQCDDVVYGIISEGNIGCF